MLWKNSRKDKAREWKIKKIIVELGQFYIQGRLKIKELKWFGKCGVDERE